LAPSSRVGPKVDASEAYAEGEAKAQARRITHNLQRQFKGRGLDPVYFEELHAATEAGDRQRFLDGVGYLLAALAEKREQTKLEAS